MTWNKKGSFNIAEKPNRQLLTIRKISESHGWFFTFLRQAEVPFDKFFGRTLPDHLPLFLVTWLQGQVLKSFHPVVRKNSCRALPVEPWLLGSDVLGKGSCRCLINRCPTYKRWIFLILTINKKHLRYRRPEPLAARNFFAFLKIILYLFKAGLEVSLKSAL